MSTISFNDLPEAVTELTRKVNELYKVITNVQPQVFILTQKYTILI